MTDRAIDYGERGRVIVVADAASLAHASARVVRDVMQEAVASRGFGYVALSGGSTPKRMGDILRTEPMRTEVPWGSVHAFWGDERWVSIESPESNAGEAIRGYLDSVPIPPDQVHPFVTMGDPAASATAYEQLVREIVPGSPVPMFDLVLLGMGDDGHTASLFPDTAALTVTNRLVVANDVARLHTTRLTFTASLINAARHVVVLVAGDGKATRLAEVLDGDQETNRLPVQLVRPTHGDLTWMVDEAAASQLARTGE